MFVDGKGRGDMGGVSIVFVRIFIVYKWSEEGNGVFSLVRRSKIIDYFGFIDVIILSFLLEFRNIFRFEGF